MSVWLVFQFLEVHKELSQKNYFQICIDEIKF